MYHQCGSDICGIDSSAICQGTGNRAGDRTALALCRSDYPDKFCTLFYCVAYRSRLKHTNKHTNRHACMSPILKRKKERKWVGKWRKRAKRSEKSEKQSKQVTKVSNRKGTARRHIMCENAWKRAIIDEWAKRSWVRVRIRVAPFRKFLPLFAF